MEEEIRQLIKKHYKKAALHDVNADLDDTIALNIEGGAQGVFGKASVGQVQGCVLDSLYGRMDIFKGNT